MSFIQAMYSFECQLNHPEKGVYTDFKLKTAQHLQESDSHLCARLLAFCHAYEADLVFENIDKDYESPEIIKRSYSGEIETCCFVGCPESKDLRHTLRSSVKDASLSVYFYHQEQLDRFLHYLRGSRNNWISSISFWLIDTEALSTLSQKLPSRVSWSVTIADDNLYIEFEGRSHAIALRALDMWQEFQKSIRNTLGA